MIFVIQYYCHSNVNGDGVGLLIVVWSKECFCCGHFIPSAEEEF